MVSGMLVFIFNKRIGFIWIQGELWTGRWPCFLLFPLRIMSPSRIWQVVPRTDWGHLTKIWAQGLTTNLAKAWDSWHSSLVGIAPLYKVSGQCSSKSTLPTPGSDLRSPDAMFLEVGKCFFLNNWRINRGKHQQDLGTTKDVNWESTLQTKGVVGFFNCVPCCPI